MPNAVCPNAMLEVTFGIIGFGFLMTFLVQFFMGVCVKAIPRKACCCQKPCTREREKKKQHLHVVDNLFLLRLTEDFKKLNCFRQINTSPFLPCPGINPLIEM